MQVRDQAAREWDTGGRSRGLSRSGGLGSASSARISVPLRSRPVPLLRCLLPSAHECGGAHPPLFPHSLPAQGSSPYQTFRSTSQKYQKCSNLQRRGCGFEGSQQELEAHISGCVYEGLKAFFAKYDEEKNVLLRCVREHRLENAALRETVEQLTVQIQELTAIIDAKHSAPCP